MPIKNDMSAHLEQVMVEEKGGFEFKGMVITLYSGNIAHVYLFCCR